MTWGGHSRAALWFSVVAGALGVAAQSADAATPYEQLAGSPSGTSVALAAGYTLTPQSAVRRTRTGITITRARLRIGGAATGERVRVTADEASGTVTVRGGRFVVPGALTRRDYTIGSVPLTIAPGGQVHGGLRPLAVARKRVGDPTVSDVGAALPAAPAGQVWSAVLSLTGEGIRFSLYLDADLVGDALVRFDGSYRIALTLRDIPVLDTKVTITGEITGSNIFDLTTITGLRGALDGDLLLSPGVHLRRGFVTWDRTGLKLGGVISLDCALGGELVGSANARLGPGEGDWAVDFGVAVGAAPCVLTDELALAPDTRAQAELRADGGKVTLSIDARATIQTDLIPTKTSFTVAFSIVAAPNGLTISVLGSTQGASFSGDIHPDGTFLITFDLDDLELFGATIGAHGRIARTAPDGALQISLSGKLRGEVWLVPDLLALTGADLGFDLQTHTITIGGTLRLMCTSGSLDLGATGTLTDEQNVMLAIAGDADQCSVGDALRLDGKTLDGKVGLKSGKLVVDLGIGIAGFQVGDPNAPPAEGFAIKTKDLSARISNQCAACADGASLEITFSGDVDIAGALPPLAAIRLGAKLRGVIRVASSGGLGKFGIALTDVTLFGVPSTLQLVIEGELARTLEAALGLPPGSITLVPGEPEPEPLGSADVPLGRPLSVTATLGTCIAGPTCKPRVGLTVRTTGRGPVALELQRQRCTSRGCRWVRVARAVLKPDAKFIARAATSRPLPSGRYRAIARPSGRSGARVTRLLRVL